MTQVSIPYLAFLYGTVLFLALALFSRTDSLQQLLADPATPRHAVVAVLAAVIYGFAIWRFRKKE